MKRIYRIKDGFSLMEMMVVMLVVAVVMALSAPMITKKAGGAGGAGCLWTSLTGGNIGFNMNTNSISAIVGGNNDQITTLGVNVPKFTIASNSNFPHIGFVHEDLMSGTLMVANNNSISLGNNAKTVGSNSIAIGTNANAATYDDTSKNSIAIGYFANAGGNLSIAIGANANSYNVSPGLDDGKLLDRQLIEFGDELY